MARREPKLRGGGMFYYWIEVGNEEVFMFSPFPIKCVQITFDRERGRGEWLWAVR